MSLVTIVTIDLILVVLPDHSEVFIMSGVSSMNHNLRLQASLWFVTALWLLQSILAFLRLYHSHNQHISGPCLLREKELLLEHSPSDRGSPSPPLPAATPTIYVWESWKVLHLTSRSKLSSKLFVYPCLHISSTIPNTSLTKNMA